MQVQKDDRPHNKSDKTVGSEGFVKKNAVELGRRAMHGTHLSHACPPIASHLQQDYLAVIEGNDCLPLEQF